jgi:hypothetical protein
MKVIFESDDDINFLTEILATAVLGSKDETGDFVNDVFALAGELKVTLQMTEQMAALSDPEALRPGDTLENILHDFGLKREDL